MIGTTSKPLDCPPSPPFIDHRHDRTSYKPVRVPSVPSVTSVSKAFVHVRVCSIASADHILTNSPHLLRIKPPQGKISMLYANLSTPASRENFPCGWRYLAWFPSAFTSPRFAFLRKAPQDFNPCARLSFALLPAPPRLRSLDVSSFPHLATSHSV